MSILIRFCLRKGKVMTIIEGLVVIVAIISGAVIVVNALKEK